jgi:hypothetical protein
MLKLLGVVALVVLILVGALMPLKYTAGMKLPGARPRPGAPKRKRSSDSAADRAD